MACPYFVPTEKILDPPWNHPARLPLGSGWLGYCSAPGHEGARPTDAEIKECCNLGYAKSCPRLPQERAADAVRFAVVRDGVETVQLRFVCERAHLPREHGLLAFDAAAGRWTTAHPDRRIQRQAECFLESYRARAHNR